jgi:hypothetical protein
MKGDFLGCRRAPENFIAMWKVAKALDSHMMLFSLFEKARTIRIFLGDLRCSPTESLWSARCSLCLSGM